MAKRIARMVPAQTRRRAISPGCGGRRSANITICLRHDAAKPPTGRCRSSYTWRRRPSACRERHRRPLSIHPKARAESAYKLESCFKPGGNPTIQRNLELLFPKVIDPEGPPPRTERHVPNSIATMRRSLIIALVSTLSRCPCCATPVGKVSRRKKL